MHAGYHATKSVRVLRTVHKVTIAEGSERAGSIVNYMQSVPREAILKVVIHHDDSMYVTLEFEDEQSHE